MFISRLNTALLEGDDEFSLHDDIHVLLVPHKDLYVAKGVFRHPPLAQAGQVVIQGRIYAATGQPPKGDKDERFTAPRILSVRYGLESYFVPEGAGRDLERQAGAGVVSVLAAVLESGEAAIKGLRVNGDNHYINPL